MQRYSRIFLTSLVLLMSTMALCPAVGQQYSIMDLGTFGGNGSIAFAINNSGHVVGKAEVADVPYYYHHAFLWTPSGGLRDLGTQVGPLNGHASTAWDINDAGQVIGWAQDQEGNNGSRGFLWTAASGMVDMVSGIGSINSAGTVTGGDANGPFIWTPLTPNGTTGTKFYLGPYNGITPGLGKINDSNQIVGSARYYESSVNADVHHAFLWTAASGYVPLGALGGAASLATDINNAGTVVGWAFTSSQAAHAILWTPTVPNGTSGTMRDLGHLGGGTSAAESINSVGQVVGSASLGDGSTHAFLWDRIHGMRDLNTLIPANSGWTLRIAHDINDAGQIVGDGINPDGKPRAFLLTPIPNAQADWRLAWQNTQNGDVSYWQLNGTSLASSGYIARSVPLAWKLVGSLDLNLDSNNDLLWHNTQTGDVSYWLMNGTTRTATSDYILRNVPLSWRPVAIADMNGDGKKDLIWQNTATGDVTYWRMNGTAIGSTGYLARSVPTTWQIVAALDLNGDTKPDLLWRNATNGDLTYWYLNGTTTTGSGYVARSVPLAWRIGGVADIDNDGDEDLVWQNSSTGDVTYWRMNGKVIAGTGYLYRGVPTAWQLRTGF